MKKEFKYRRSLRDNVWSVIGLLIVFAIIYFSGRDSGLYNDVWEFIQKAYGLLLILTVLFLIAYRTGGSLSISSKGIKFYKEEYIWSDVKSVRLAQIEIEPGFPEKVLLLELKNPNPTSYIISKYYENSEKISPMDPEKTIGWGIDWISKRELTILENTLCQYTKVHQALREKLEIKLPSSKE